MVRRGIIAAAPLVGNPIVSECPTDNALAVRRDVAAALGLQTEEGTDPGPVDFSSKKVQKKMGELFRTHYGRDAFKMIASQPFPDEYEQKEKKEKKRVRRKIKSRERLLSDDPVQLAKQPEKNAGSIREAV
jgi:hypothetical protein